MWWPGPISHLNNQPLLQEEAGSPLSLISSIYKVGCCSDL